MPLFDDIDTISARIKGSKGVLLFLDFDGTLAPIAASPREASLPEKTRLLLEKLKAVLSIVIVSGRSLSDIRERVGLTGLSYAGNHGLEWAIEDAEGHMRIEESHVERIREVSAVLKPLLASYEGALIEEKGYTVALHFRMVDAARRDALLYEAGEALLPIRERGGITVTHGKMLIEVRPDVPWHKGAFIRMAIDRLSRGKNVLSIFIGDDETDEDAFSTLPEAITVRVGDIQESAAQYCMEPRARVDEFLEWLLGEVSEGART